MIRLFGREPAYWMSLFAGLLAMASALGLSLSVEQQGVLNAALAMIFGAITAVKVASEKAVPALVGAFKALIAVALAFGWTLSPEVQSSVVLVVELVLTGVLVRPNVTAPVPAARPLA